MMGVYPLPLQHALCLCRRMVPAFVLSKCKIRWGRSTCLCRAGPTIPFCAVAYDVCVTSDLILYSRRQSCAHARLQNSCVHLGTGLVTELSTVHTCQFCSVKRSYETISHLYGTILTSTAAHTSYRGWHVQKCYHRVARTTGSWAAASSQVGTVDRCAANLLPPCSN